MGTTYENSCVITFKDTSDNIHKMYPITNKENVRGLNEALRNPSITTSGDGSNYVATVPGITSLTAGVSFTMIPHVDSTSSSPMLNVNGLGSARIRRLLSSSNASTYSAKTPDNWLSANRPVNVMYNGLMWIADMPVPYGPDVVGTIEISNGGTGATTAQQARVNLGIETGDGTVTSGNADYAEVGQWTDNNPNAEDRIGYFVCVDLDNPGIIMKKAAISDDVRGVTVTRPAFAGGCSDDKFDDEGNLLPAYSYVAVMGIVPVIDNGTCSVGGRCIPGSDSTAVPVDGDYGYQVMDRIDDTHVLIAVEPGADYQYKFKEYIDNKHLNATATLSTNWTGDVAPYKQTIAVEGILASDSPYITAVYSNDVMTAIAEKESWGMVSDANVSNGSIEFVCFDDKPINQINIQIEVNR